jgi:hypothetical protein
LKKLILLTLLSFGSYVNAADFTIDFVPKANSVGNAQIQDGSLSISKINSFMSEVVSAMSSSLSGYLSKAEIKSPKLIKFTTVGLQTYTPSAGVKYFKIKMVGGGGGGAGGGQSGTFGYAAAGTTTQFGTQLIAEGGAGGIEGTTLTTGGSASCGTVVDCQAFHGGYGGGFGYGFGSNGATRGGGNGATSPFGGAGGAQSDRGGIVAVNYSGSGGGGGDSSGGCPNTCRSGGGGNAGGYLEAIVENTQSSYSVLIGSGGGGGYSGSYGYGGASGGSGIMMIEEHFQ